VGLSAVLKLLFNYSPSSVLIEDLDGTNALTLAQQISPDVATLVHSRLQEASAPDEIEADMSFADFANNAWL
jgi:hypothetical protein